MEQEYLPRTVRSVMDELLEATGVPATVERSGNTYQVSHGNDRVRLGCRYVRNTQGKFSYSSTLSVDGVEREHVNGAAAYARLLADPDDPHPNRRPGCELPPVYPLNDGEEIPALIDGLARKVGDEDSVVTVIVGHSSMAQRERWSAWTWDLNDDDAFPDDAAYTVEAVKDNGNRLQLHMQPYPRVPGLFYISGVSAVDSDGRDLVGDFKKDINAAVKALLGITIPHQRVPDRGAARPAGDSKGAVSNSVQVRKATVFRI